MTDSVFWRPQKLQVMETTKDKNPNDLNAQDNPSFGHTTDTSNLTPAIIHTRSNMLDVPFTPQQRSFLMSILGLGGQEVATREPSTPPQSRHECNL